MIQDLYAQKAAVEEVLEMLRDAGYKAYVMGGAARDLHHMRTPKDYDIIILADADVDSVAGALDMCTGDVVPFGEGTSMRSVEDSAKHSSHLDFVVKLTHGGVDIDVIKYVEDFDTPEQAVEHFDLTINMAWLDEGGRVALHNRFPLADGDKVELLPLVDYPHQRVRYFMEKYPRYLYPTPAEVEAFLYNRAKEGT